MSAHRYPPLVLALALALAGCDQGRQRAEKQLAAADISALRHDAAVVYKNALGSSTVPSVTVGLEAWPKSFTRFQPSRVTVYRDGVALVLLPTADGESGLYILPEGLANPPTASARATFEQLRTGVYWYAFGRR